MCSSFWLQYINPCNYDKNTFWHCMAIKWMRVCVSKRRFYSYHAVTFRIFLRKCAVLAPPPSFRKSPLCWIWILVFLCVAMTRWKISQSPSALCRMWEEAWSQSKSSMMRHSNCVSLLAALGADPTKCESVCACFSQHIYLCMPVSVCVRFLPQSSVISATCCDL